MAISLPRSPRIWIPIGLSLVALSMGVLAFKAEENKRWDAMQVRLAELEAKCKASSYEREPLGGEGTEGSAWEHYLAAFARNRETDRVELARRVQGVFDLAGEERRVEVSQLEEVMAFELESVQRGARCRDATPAVDWTKGPGEQVQTLMGAYTLTGLLVLSGLADVDEGRTDVGCAKILDALQFGQDFTTSPLLINQMIGLSQVLPNGWKGFLESEGLQALPEEALRILEAGYTEYIDRAKTKPTLMGELVLLGNDLARLDEEGFSHATTEGIAQTPAMALAPRWVIANGILTLADTYEELERLEGTAYRDRVATLGEQWENSDNPLLQNFWISRSVEHSYRYNLVLAKMVRRALREGIGLPLEPFVDPHGEALSESHDDEYLRYEIPNGEYPIKLQVRR